MPPSAERSHVIDRRPGYGPDIGFQRLKPDLGEPALDYAAILQVIGLVHMNQHADSVRLARFCPHRQLSFSVAHNAWAIRIREVVAFPTGFKHVPMLGYEPEWIKPVSFN